MANVTRAEYLKRYMSDDSDKKKKKKKIKKGLRPRIFDDDVDLKSLLPDNLGNSLDDDLMENLPTVADVIDERPAHVQHMEQFQDTSLWKTLISSTKAEDGEIISDKSDDEVQIDAEEDRHRSPKSDTSSRANPESDSNVSPLEKKKFLHDEETLIKTGEDLTQSLDKEELTDQISLKSGQNDSDLDQSLGPVAQEDSGSDKSPSRRLRHNLSSDKSPKRRCDSGSESDHSPQREEGLHSDSDQSLSKKARHNSDSDQSLSKKGRHDSDSDQSMSKRSRHDSDSDHSSSRRRRHDSNSDHSSSRHRRHDSDSNHSSSRRRRHDSDSDHSKSKKAESDSDRSVARRTRHSSDSDQSVPRPTRHDSDSDRSSSDSDQPVPRRRPYTSSRTDRNTSSEHPLPKRQETDFDNSPPRRKKSIDSDSDQSPPRASRRDSDLSPQRKKAAKSGQISHQRFNHSSALSKDRRNLSRSRDDYDSDLSPPRHGSSTSPRRGDNKGRPLKTLGGARAGLSSAAEMRKEARNLRQKEEKIFQQLDASTSGKDAETVIRERSTGRRRDLKQEQLKKDEELKKKAEKDAKYADWGKGLKQKAQQQQAVQDSVYEMTKPLARYKDDKDLDQMMREQDRAGDPMLAFIKKKKKPEKDEKPRYKGPPAPPNRFGIGPGFRWDGVDRSNGFEQQLFAKMADKKATALMAYKWSTEDM